MLAELEPAKLVELVLASPPLAEEILSENADLDTLVAAGLEGAGPKILESARRRFLRHMTGERHAEAFRILVSGMSGADIIAQIKRLDDATGLQSLSLNAVLINEAKHAGAAPLVRDFVASLRRSPASDAMLTDLIEPTEEDVRWLVDQPFLDRVRRRSLLLTQVEIASSQTLARLFSDSGLLSRVRAIVGDLDDVSTTSLAKIAENVPLVTEEGLALLLQILPHLGELHAAELVARSLYTALGRETIASRVTAVQHLLESAGKSLDARKAIQNGLSVGVPSSIASQNLILFDSAPPAIRAQFVDVPEAIAEGIIERRHLDLSYEGANAAGHLIWDASEGNRPAFAWASAALLPFAMRERCQPASALIAAAFPSVYHGLQQEHTPDFFSLLMFPFVDWDRCKTARRELATGFSSSEWLATDIALAAARAGDAPRILRVVALPTDARPYRRLNSTSEKSNRRGENRYRSHFQRFTNRLVSNE
ncbi:hypothetical protein E9536_40875 [Burkholderia sp. LS-044]|uniref:hypothetical protein n=1 Tax=Burkholderia sp. LS-044 TaxID=1459967 RepID=UPI0010A64193|nr:hypothetical protein [Burkholderia sp. LS-044]THJ45637.1 hypothetical protein E9536_40875 [Burkholderia sp. LS-044]